MLTFEEIRKLKRLYVEGGNIMEYFRSQNNEDYNTKDAILYSYDLQSGSYTRAMDNQDHYSRRVKFAQWVCGIIKELDENCETVLDMGTGEATLLAHVMVEAQLPHARFYGNDISLSRLFYAKAYLRHVGVDDATLFAADMGNIPLPDDVVDIVYTSHALEPNHGRERPLLEELLRITRRFLILIEPSYELGTQEQRKYMEKHGYVRGLPEIIDRLGFNIVRHELLDLELVSNSLNRPAVIVVEKQAYRSTADKAIGFISPISKCPMRSFEGGWYCEEDGHYFPEINSIPCLLKENGILATKLADFVS